MNKKLRNELKEHIWIKLHVSLSIKTWQSNDVFQLTLGRVLKCESVTLVTPKVPSGYSDGTFGEQVTGVRKFYLETCNGTCHQTTVQVTAKVTFFFFALESDPKSRRAIAAVPSKK